MSDSFPREDPLRTPARAASSRHGAALKAQRNGVLSSDGLWGRGSREVRRCSRVTGSRCPTGAGGSQRASCAATLDLTARHHVRRSRRTRRGPECRPASWVIGTQCVSAILATTPGGSPGALMTRPRSPPRHCVWLDRLSSPDRLRWNMRGRGRAHQSGECLNSPVPTPDGGHRQAGRFLPPAPSTHPDAPRGPAAAVPAAPAGGAACRASVGVWV
jgi:hypothetical protein